MKKISHYIALIISIAMLFNASTNMCAEAKEGPLARVWQKTKAYAGKTARRIGLDTKAQKASQKLKQYRTQARKSIKKLVSCLRGKETCSKKDIRKARIYTGLVIAALIVTAGGTYLKMKSKRTEEGIEEEEEVEKKQLELVEKRGETIENIIKRNDPAAFNKKLNELTEKELGKINATEQIQKWIHTNWDKLDDKTKVIVEGYDLIKLTEQEDEDVEEILRSSEREPEVATKPITPPTWREWEARWWSRKPGKESEE